MLAALMHRIVPWLLPLGLVVGWQAGASWGWISSRVLPAPFDIATALVSLTASGELIEHMQISCSRALAGFVLGGAVGLALGFWTGTSHTMERLLDTSVQMVRNVPHLALIPLVILWFGIDEEAKLFLIALGVMFPIYLNTFHGIRSVDRQLVEMGAAYGLRPLGPASRRDPARRAALDPGRRALLARPDVADPDRRRDHLRAARHRLHDDERARVPADRRRRARRSCCMRCSASWPMWWPGRWSALAELEPCVPASGDVRCWRRPASSRCPGSPRAAWRLRSGASSGPTVRCRCCAAWTSPFSPASSSPSSGAAAAARARCCALSPELETPDGGTIMSTATIAGTSTSTRASCSRTRACCPGRGCSTTSGSAWPETARPKARAALAGVGLADRARRLAGGAVRRPAPARGAGARAGACAAPAAARRAARRAGRADPHRDAAADRIAVAASTASPRCW